MKKSIYSIFFFLSIFASCTYYNEEELFPNEVCDTENITYQQDILPIFEKACYSCHSSNTPVIYYGNLNLENFDHIQKVVDDGQLLRNIKHELDGLPMPQGGAKLSDCNIAKIEKWIIQGIPNN